MMIDDHVWLMEAVRAYDRSLHLTPNLSLKKKRRAFTEVRAHATPICKRVCQEISQSVDPLTTLKREEFAVGVGGAGYADIGILKRFENFINAGESLDILCGYEIKSAADSLARFPIQRKLYDDVFDFNTLILTPNHWAAAEKLIPLHWGLWIARPTEGVNAVAGEYTLEIVKRAELNPYQERVALVDLLWKSELVKVMDIIQPKHGLRKYGKHMVRTEILKALPDAELKQHVYKQLRARVKYWWTFENPARNLQ